VMPTTMASPATESDIGRKVGIRIQSSVGKHDPLKPTLETVGQ
jgi:hypothetical protein